ncbi:hypothetical protein [Glutamicibacter nicotianae]|uniref:hypothetical protein n=1 Tax=Glutamicibacter nicotianae TaxID=37929 RepID=UPI00195C9992|nr:hypothetical protein [Glutamicibacter nicotianae]MBM7767365.1 hypothetical protein [Glutamicibacter nicotianae]
MNHETVKVEHIELPVIDIGRGEMNRVASSNHELRLDASKVSKDNLVPTSVGNSDCGPAEIHSRTLVDVAAIQSAIEQADVELEERLQAGG